MHAADACPWKNFYDQERVRAQEEAAVRPAVQRDEKVKQEATTASLSPQEARLMGRQAGMARKRAEQAMAVGKRKAKACLADVLPEMEGTAKQVLGLESHCSWSIFDCLETGLESATGHVFEYHRSYAACCWDMLRVAHMRLQHLSRHWRTMHTVPTLLRFNFQSCHVMGTLDLQ